MKSNEYTILRKEIDQKISLHNTLLTFTLTTTVALLAFALDSDNTNSFLFLLPFCIVIPMLGRIAYYRKAMAKLSAYLIVFCEAENDSEYTWETRNMQYNKIFGSSKGFALRYYECFVVSLVCVILFVWHYKSQVSYKPIHLVWPFGLLLWELSIVRKINGVDKDRLCFIKEWEFLKSCGNIPYWQEKISSHQERNHSADFKRYTGGISICTTREKDAANPIHKARNTLDILLIQSISTVIYIFGIDISEHFFARDTVALLFSLIVYICFILLTLALTKKLILPHKYGFSEEDFGAVFLVHLVGAAVFYFVAGCIFAENKLINAGILTITLFVGFAISLSDVIKSNSVLELLRCIIEQFQKAQISVLSFTLILGVDAVYLGLAFLIPTNPQLFGTVFGCLMLMLFLINWVRSKYANMFVNKVLHQLKDESQCLIWNIGHENAIIRRFKKYVQECENEHPFLGETPKHRSYDIIVVINTFSPKVDINSELNEIRKFLKPNGVVFDPSITNKLHRRYGLYSLFGIPNRNPQDYNAKQYKQIINSWK